MLTCFSVACIGKYSVQIHYILEKNSVHSCALVVLQLLIHGGALLYKMTLQGEPVVLESALFCTNNMLHILMSPNDSRSII